MFLFCSNSRSPLLRGGCNASDRFQRGEGGPPAESPSARSPGRRNANAAASGNWKVPARPPPSERSKPSRDRERASPARGPSVRHYDRSERCQARSQTRASSARPSSRRRGRRKPRPRTGKRIAEKCRVGGVDDATVRFFRAQSAPPSPHHAARRRGEGKESKPRDPFCPRG